MLVISQYLWGYDPGQSDVRLVVLEVDVLNSVEDHVVQQTRSGRFCGMVEHLVIEGDPLPILDRTDLDLATNHVGPWTIDAPSTVGLQRKIRAEDVVTKVRAFLLGYTTTAGSVDEGLLAEGTDHRVVDLLLQCVSRKKTARILEDLCALIDSEVDGFSCELDAHIRRRNGESSR